MTRVDPASNFTWSAETCQPISSPFEGHTNYVMSVAFSHGGEHVVSGPWVHTARIWDTETGQTVSDPFEVHMASARSVTFSPNGQRVVSSLSSQFPVMNSAQVAFNDAENTRMFTDQSTLDFDGWIQGPHSELLFWVPPQNRAGLWWPSNISVLARSSTKIDFSRFLHGDRWTRCWS